MGAFLVSKIITISSHKHEYTADFNKSFFQKLTHELDPRAIYILDRKLVDIYHSDFRNIIQNTRYILIEATEENKSLDKFPNYIEQLTNLGLKRDQKLIAVGGGIIQDITCFLASTIMRGIPWEFYPTTLLAQADSCIGSKSSINSGSIKNILGTFYPPKKIFIDVNILKTLENKDLLSGIGEMLKVHAIDSPEKFNDIADKYESLFEDNTLLEEYIFKSLQIKKKYIEIDEFDEGPRNIMNYGHSFGHAIETATNYEIPHGIAITIGMDVANFSASDLSISNHDNFTRMHTTLRKNYKSYIKTSIDASKLLEALDKDKKNTTDKLKLILPDQDGFLNILLVNKGQKFNSTIEKYFSEYWKI
jgi:3-dehydroquinate synthase